MLACIDPSCVYISMQRKLCIHTWTHTSHTLKINMFKKFGSAQLFHEEKLTATLYFELMFEEFVVFIMGISDYCNNNGAYNSI